MSFVVFLIYSRLDKAKESAFQDADQESERFIIRDVFKFKPSFWFITILCVTIYSAVLPFVAFSNIFLQKEFGMTAAQGGFYASLIFITTMVCTPFFGLLIDKIGKRAMIMVVGSLIIVPVFLSLGLTKLHPSLPIIGLGVAFSLVPSALWSSIPILVEEKHLGTAFGITYLIQNVGLTLFPWLAGKITDLSDGDYTNTMILFASLGIVALVFSLMLKFAERKGKGTGIELPSKMLRA
jgi:MFS family permease